MRGRSHSGVRLDQLMLIVEKTIMVHQDPVTGLFANNAADFPDHAWIRDNVYAVQAVWAMYRAYQKKAEFDEDLAKAHELGLTCVKTMQSLMECMLRQSNKVEIFKKHQRSRDSIHSKYSTRTKSEVVGDNDWGHLQIDAVSLFLLTLAQITASGLQIVRNFDEVAFIQNLVYYIETGYKTPDFGVWERGDKTNQGICELNASSIGMAKAALQALNDVGDLFGDGSKSSLIHVMLDEIQQCSAVLSSMLPRESFSKETDAALLSIISYPAFAVEDIELVELTRSTIINTLYGRYGCRRFLRDGYKHALEDSNRLYYINAELQKFENIECEWPLFICYLLLDAMFSKDQASIDKYWKQLNSIVIPDPFSSKYSFIQLVPELYKVPYDKVELERANHGSQDRIPAGTLPFLWAQSLYVICCLIHDGFLSPAELDPLSRRLSVIEKRPACEVQIVILAESVDVQHELALNDIQIQLLSEIDSIFSVQPASVLAKIFNKLGSSKKLCISGRPLDRDVELLSTSRLYHLGDKFFAFMPQFMDNRRSHLTYDIRILMDQWSSELQYIYTSWNSSSISGRPLVVLVLTKNMLQTNFQSLNVDAKVLRRQKTTVLSAIKKIKNGYIGGARVVMKNLSEFFRTTSISDFDLQVLSIEKIFAHEKRSLPRSLKTVRPSFDESFNENFKLFEHTDSVKSRWSKQFDKIHQASMRHRSMVLDSNDADLLKLRFDNSTKTDEKVSNNNGLMSPVINEGVALTNNISSAHLHTLYSDDLVGNKNAVNNSVSKLHHRNLEGLKVEEVICMLGETTLFDEQASLVHFLFLKYGFDFDTKFNNVNGVTVRILVEEIYVKACECRDWAWVRLMAGLLGKQLDELSKAVTHLLVRQKQITVGKPSKNTEEAITCPKTKKELKEIFDRCYYDDPNSYILAQELIVSLGSLVRTEPRLFEEVFRLRIGLIIQILASELARLRNLSADAASQKLLSISPFELKSMLFLLLSGRLLEDLSSDDDTIGKELQTGIGSFRKQIEERKSMRKTKSIRTRLDGNFNLSLPVKEEASDSDTDLTGCEDFVFGIWLRHRRIDGALNRVPAEFYEKLWDTLRLFPQGIIINQSILHRSLTQEMTRKEIKFALQVEQFLNLIAEPEYREIIIEALTLLGGNLDKLLIGNPQIRNDKPFEVETIVYIANRLFVEHNKLMSTIVLECCASGNNCNGARGICKHFYDSAPAGEYGTTHYLIKALFEIFG